MQKFSTNIRKPNVTTHLKKKGSYATLNLDSSYGHKDGSTYANQCDIPCQQKKKQKSHYHLNKFRESI